MTDRKAGVSKGTKHRKPEDFHLPETREHPQWPAFQAWAAENLSPGQLLVNFWTCWRAASRQPSKYIPRRVKERNLTHALLMDVLRSVDHLLVTAKGLEGPGGLYHKLNVLRKNGLGGWVRFGPGYLQADGTIRQMLIRWSPDLVVKEKEDA